MENRQLPFQYGEIQDCNSIFEKMNFILKDTDASKEKEIIREFLQKTADTFRFVVIGDSAVGKTSLLKSLFGDTVVYHGEANRIL